MRAAVTMHSTRPDTGNASNAGQQQQQRTTGRGLPGSSMGVSPTTYRSQESSDIGNGGVRRRAVSPGGNKSRVAFQEVDREASTDDPTEDTVQPGRDRVASTSNDGLDDPAPTDSTPLLQGHNRSRSGSNSPFPIPAPPRIQIDHEEVLMPRSVGSSRPTSPSHSNPAATTPTTPSALTQVGAGTEGYKSPTLRQKIAFELDTSRSGRLLDLFDAFLSFAQCALYVVNTTYVAPPLSPLSEDKASLRPLFIDRTNAELVTLDDAMAAVLGGHGSDKLLAQGRRKNAIPLPFPNICGELVITGLMLVLLLFRAYVAPSRSYFFTTWFAVFTLAATLPTIYLSYMSAGPIVYAFPARWARFHEALNTVLMPVKDPLIRMSPVARKTANVTGAIFFTLLTVSALIHITLYKDERQLVRDSTFLDIFYFTVMSSTSGLSTTITHDPSRSKFTKPYQNPGNQSHVVVTGTLDVNAIVEFLREFFCPDHGPSTITTTVVFLAPDEPSDPAYVSRVTYIKGTPTSFRALDRAQTRDARAVFVLSSKMTSESGDPLVDDAETIMRSLAIKKYFPTMPVFAQCLLPENQSQYFYLADKVLCIEELTLGMLAQSARVPGFSTLVSLLCSSMTDDSRRELVKETDKQGMGFLKPMIPSRLIYINFGACLMALGVPVERTDLPPSLRFHIVLNPSEHVITGEETGLLIGTESAVVRQISEWKESMATSAEVPVPLATGAASGGSRQSVVPPLGTGSKSMSVPKLTTEDVDSGQGPASVLSASPPLPAAASAQPASTPSSSSPIRRMSLDLSSLSEIRTKITAGAASLASLSVVSETQHNDEDHDNESENEATALDVSGGGYNLPRTELDLGLNAAPSSAASASYASSSLHVTGSDHLQAPPPSATHMPHPPPRRRRSLQRVKASMSRTGALLQSSRMLLEDDDDCAGADSILAQDVRKHIILCDASPGAVLPEHLDLFMQPLRDPKINHQMPVDLVRAGVERASKLVVMCSQKSNKRVADAGSILTALNAESSKGAIFCVIEPVCANHPAPSFMAGHAFSASLLDGILAQSYYSPHVLSLIKRLVFSHRPTLLEKLMIQQKEREVSSAFTSSLLLPETTKSPSCRSRTAQFTCWMLA
ncbi:hypothetical protein BCR44DRAFT_1496231 [Catenaria anguillulae PL171]|uniref:Uncharacterized protein n=1 Tax=Catenaria anguillulae PL171 TaxID=765915 RepID=A0A1Y2I250_9FUNG|nr:hypothetical protein BCR44DRAFT_1496231 [Catenaria anguillulae PL171]